MIVTTSTHIAAAMRAVFITTSTDIPAAMRAAFIPAAMRAAVIPAAMRAAVIPAAMCAAFITTLTHIPAAMRAVVLLPLCYPESEEVLLMVSKLRCKFGSKTISTDVYLQDRVKGICLLSQLNKVTDLGCLPLGSALGTALDGRSLFSFAEDVVVFPMGRNEDEDDKGKEDEDYKEDEEPRPKAMLAFARSYAAWGSACRSCCHHVSDGAGLYQLQRLFS